MSKLGTATNAVSRPTRISISYAALVALITEAVLFVQDVAVHHVWTERDTLFVIAAAAGIITLVGPFLPVPVSFDAQDSPPPADTPVVVKPELSSLAPLPSVEPAAGESPPAHEAANPWLPAQ